MGQFTNFPINTRNLSEAPEITSLQSDVATINSNKVPKTRKVNGKALSSDITIGPELIWTNSSTSTYAGTTVTIQELSDYKMIIIECITYASNYRMAFVMTVDSATHIMSGTPSSGKIVTRTAKPSTAGTIVFGGGNMYNTYGSSTADDAAMIPIKVYGLREGTIS